MKALSLFFVPPDSTSPPVFSMCQSSVPWKLAPVFLVFFLEHRNKDAHVKGTRTVTLEESNSHLQQEVVQSLSTHPKAQTGDLGGAPRPR